MTNTRYFEVNFLPKHSVARTINIFKELFIDTILTCIKQPHLLGKRQQFRVVIGPTLLKECFEQTQYVNMLIPDSIFPGSGCVEQKGPRDVEAMVYMF